MQAAPARSHRAGSQRRYGTRMARRPRAHPCQHRRPSAGPALPAGLVWSPPPESNRRPHPYHGTHREPLCGAPYPQVKLDRWGRSYRFSSGEVMRSLSSQPLIVSGAGIFLARDMSPGTASLLHPGIHPTDVPPPRYLSRSISTLHSSHPARAPRRRRGTSSWGGFTTCPAHREEPRPPKERVPVVGASCSSSSAGSPG